MNLASEHNSSIGTKNAKAICFKLLPTADFAPFVLSKIPLRILLAAVKFFLY